MKWIAIIFGLFIVGIIILANMGMLRMLGFINEIPNGDKIGHFILYGVLTLLIDLAFIRSRPDLSPNLIVLRVAFVLALLIGLEEYSQKFIPSRTFSLVDLVYGYVGVILFSLLALRSRGGS